MSHTFFAFRSSFSAPACIAYLCAYGYNLLECTRKRTRLSSIIFYTTVSCLALGNYDVDATGR